jgi:phosphopantothenoylcysteine decarboxylase/phosphopantothenate--cysteine ligase
MAAAPADFRPADRADHKIKKQPDGVTPTISLVENPDILADLVTRRGTAKAPILVGFAAETGDDRASVLDHGRTKLARKGCDWLVVNDVSGGAVFGQDDNQAVILGADGSERPVPRGSKSALAQVIWDVVR